MKGIIPTLREEHRLIGRAAACLDRLADEALESNDLCVTTAIELLEFFEDFGDGAHQEKEERHLFPALLRSGLATHRVLGLLGDHQHEREVLRNMWHLLEAAAHGDGAQREDFLRYASEFATMQREHAEEENEFLLPLVEELLDDEAKRQALEGFHQVDRERLPKPVEYYHALVEKAAARLGSGAWAAGSALELPND